MMTKQLIWSQLISEIKASGLRGRGGAGFPSGLKYVSLLQLGFSRTEADFGSLHSRS